MSKNFRRLTTLVSLAVAVHAAAPAARVVGGAALAVQTPSAGSVTSWVGHEATVEEWLRTLEIDHLESIPVGVTTPRRAFFQTGAPLGSAAWKPLWPSRRTGYWESYKSEIAAYELDKLLGLHMVPPAVEREIGGETGALILWLDGTKNWNLKQSVAAPLQEWNQQVSRMKMFDQLISNIDRNAGNVLYDSGWRLFLIDHSRAFTDRKTPDGTQPLQGVDRQFWQRINAVTRADLDRVLAPWLDQRAIDAIVSRRERMSKDIEKRVAKRGEASVFLW